MGQEYSSGLFPDFEVYDLDKHWETMRRMKVGEITAEELKKSYELCRDQGGVVASLNKKTVKELKRWTYHGRKKGELVKLVHQNLLGSYVIPTGESISYMWNESYIGAVNKLVETLTDEQIQAYAAEVAAKKAAEEKALSDPETLDDFVKFDRKFGLKNLSDEKLALFDRLSFEKARDQAHAAAQKEVEAIDLGGEGLMTFKESWHSKRECEIWIVGLTERLEREIYAPLAKKARMLGARWSTWGPKEDHGFVFWNEQDALSFMGLAEGENADLTERIARREEWKRQKAADRLERYADDHLDAADMELNRERLENTWRRAQIASNAEARANSDKAFALTTANVASALKRGELEGLAKLKYATQLAELILIFHRATADAVYEESDRYVPSDERRSTVLADVRFAKFPWPFISVDVAVAAAANLKGKRGVSRARKILENWAAKVHEDGKHWFKLVGMSQSLAVMEALHKTGQRNQEKLKDSFAPFKRLIQMGIGDPAMMRHGLRELLPYMAEVDKESELKKAVRALAGMKLEGFFPTTQPTLALLEDWLPEVEEGEPFVIWEPSCGTGNILDWLRMHYPDAEVLGYELRYALAEIVRMKGHRVEIGDFLQVEIDEPHVDLVVMNPSFENEADIDHVLHAAAFVKPGGRLIAIMSEHTFHSNTKKAQGFRSYLDAVGAHYEKLPEGSFKESGTGTATRFVVIDIPERMC